MSTNFDNFTLGSVSGQNGWTSGSGYPSCPVFDVAVVPNTYGYASFGAQSLRISNGITCGGIFIGQTFSPLLADEAGETDAASSTSPNGTREPYFEAQWDFASAQPGSEQPGLSVVASPDSGNGSRESWLEMEDTPTGLELDFYDYEASSSNFVLTPIATSIDRTISHTVKITIQFIDGPSNDIVQVYLDGVLIHTGTSWEDYDRSVGSEPSAIDAVMFRVVDPAVPSVLGKGFLIDNFSESSGPLPIILATLHVIDDDTGFSASSTFNMHVEQNGSDVLGSPAAGTATPGILYLLSPGIYAISESVLNASYSQSFSGDCDVSGIITLFASDNKTCTIINTYIPPVIALAPPAPPPVNHSSGGGGYSSGGTSPVYNPPTTITTVTTNIIPGLPNTGSVIPGLPNTGAVMSAVFTNHLNEGSPSNVYGDVIRLQTLLASDRSIYPSGLVTGYFGTLTHEAVEAFQIKYGVAYAGDIGFGTVGPFTRAMLQKVFGQ